MNKPPAFADYEHLLLPALNHTEAGTTMEDVREAVRSGNALMWPGKNSVAISTEYRAREFVIWLAGGDMGELFEMEKAASHVARLNGFTRMCVEDGRHGWGRALTRIGYRPVRQMVKDL